jgi:predicted nucleotidyltransferase
MKTAGELDLHPQLRGVLDEAVARIVEIAKPQAVILFGSHAEGHARPHSDFDLMVIADSENVREVEGDLYEAMADMAEDWGDQVPPIDIIVMTPKEWEHEVQLPGLLCFRIHRHGVVLHGRAA